MVGRQDCESFATAPSIMHLTNGVEANSVAVPAASVFMDVSFSELTLTIINATNTPSAVVDVGKKSLVRVLEGSKKKLWNVHQLVLKLCIIRCFCLFSFGKYEWSHSLSPVCSENNSMHFTQARRLI